MIAEVARNDFELRGEQTQLAVARANVKNQQQVLGLAQAELEAGSGTDLDVARAQSQLSTTLSTIGPLEAAVSRSIHRLSVLTGRDPDALAGVLSAPHDLPPLPAIVPVGTPDELLRRRADIRLLSAIWRHPPHSSAWQFRISSPRLPSRATSAMPRPSRPTWARAPREVT